MWHLAFENYSYFSPHSANSCKVLIDSSLAAPLSALALDQDTPDPSIFHTRRGDVQPLFTCITSASLQLEPEMSINGSPERTGPLSKTLLLGNSPKMVGDALPQIAAAAQLCIWQIIVMINRVIRCFFITTNP